MKHFLDRVEFYITNVCNYSCEQCNRFNNYHFSGQQRWEDYKEVYIEWGKRIDFNYITILGGEPLLNPTINEWINGIAGIWKKPQIEIVTNGSRLNKVPGLYAAMIGTESQLRPFIHIGIHHIDMLARNMASAYEFLSNNVIQTDTYPVDINDHWLVEYKKISYDHWPECNTPDEFNNLPADIQDQCRKNNFSDTAFLNTKRVVRLVDENNIAVEIHIEDMFHRSALRRIKDELFVHDSDPEQAHSICCERTNHHYMQGKLYKCNVTSVLPEFYKQFDVALSEEDLNLMNSYVPLEVNDDDITTCGFINDLPNAVPQCKFCPEWLEGFKLQPTAKKIKINKKHK
jgi:organic radical activating enzyme